MSSNRPFFTNFFSAFRARTSPTFQAKSSGPASVISPTALVASAHVSTINATVNSTTSSRTITTKPISNSNVLEGTNTAQTPTTNPLSFTNPATHRYVPPTSRSPGTSSPGGPYSHTNPNPNLSMSPPYGGASTPIPRGRQRRGSDSSNSSGGFMDALGPEKWYVGGRTATGEETFYRLGLVSGGTGKRVRSLDRLSL